MSQTLTWIEPRSQIRHKHVFQKRLTKTKSCILCLFFIVKFQFLLFNTTDNCRKYSIKVFSFYQNIRKYWCKVIGVAIWRCTLQYYKSLTSATFIISLLPDLLCMIYRKFGLKNFNFYNAMGSFFSTNCQTTADFCLPLSFFLEFTSKEWILSKAQPRRQKGP